MQKSIYSIIIPEDSFPGAFGTDPGGATNSSQDTGILVIPQSLSTFYTLASSRLILALEVHGFQRGREQAIRENVTRELPIGTTYGTLGRWLHIGNKPVIHEGGPDIPLVFFQTIEAVVTDDVRINAGFVPSAPGNGAADRTFQ
jgi:hypothetical protein